MSTPGRVSNRAHTTAAHIATALTTRSSLHYRTDRIEQHYIDACPFTMMDCLFGCGARHARQDTESHAAVCPNVLAECDAGCGWRCKRVEMPSHVIICPLREAECPNKWWDQRSACRGGSNSRERRPARSLSHSSPPRSSLYRSTAWDYSLRTYVTTIGYSSCGTVLRPGDIAEHMKVCPYARIDCARGCGMCGPRWLVERAGGFAAHEKVCPMVTVACQNAGCGAVLPRSQIGYHVAHECVHRKIRCMWCSKGWGIQVRARMGRHSPPHSPPLTPSPPPLLRHPGVPSPLPAVHGTPHLRRLEVDHAGAPLRRLRRLVGRRLHRGVRVGETSQGTRGASRDSNRGQRRTAHASCLPRSSSLPATGALPVHDGAVHEREGGVHRARPPLSAQRPSAVGVQARGCVVRALWREDAPTAAEESPVAAARRAVPLRLRPPLQV